MFFNFGCWIQRSGPASEQSTKSTPFTEPSPFQPVGKYFRTTLRRCFQPHDSPLNKLTEGAKPKQNPLILFPDQDLIPSAGSHCLASPASCLAHPKAPPAWLVETKPLLRPAQHCVSARAATGQQGKQPYFTEKLSKAPSASIHGQDSEPG